VNEAVTQHPSQDQLSAFALGRLSPREQDEVERHVAACQSCCESLRAVPDDTLAERLRRPETSTDGTVPPPAKPAARPQRAEPPVPPELLDHPRYRIVRALGAGGMGVVYQAEHRIMERTVAIKVINRHYVNNPQAIERFRQEVRLAARLSHPNIVAAHDADQAGDLHFLVMEFVDGVSLARRVEKRGPFTIQQASNFVRQAALGLQHAFERGMVHRDIKPQNLMLSRTGQIKILDFGLARIAREADPDGTGMMPALADKSIAGLTMAGQVLGTPDYIAPEQVNDARHADIRADIYSLGCTLYYLLCGHVPFPRGSATQKLISHTEMDPVPIRRLRDDLPEELVAIVERMMAKSPADRFQTPADVVQALALLAKSASSIAPDTPTQSAPRTGELTRPREAFRPADEINLAAALGDLVDDEPASAPGRAYRLAATEPLTPPPTGRRTGRGRAGGDLGRALGQAALKLGGTAAVLGVLAVVGWKMAIGIVGSPDPSGSTIASPTVETREANPGFTAMETSSGGGAAAPASGYVRPDATPTRAGQRPAPPAASTGRHRVVFVLASRGFYYPDYSGVYDVLKAEDVDVVIASSKVGTLEPDAMGGGDSVESTLNIRDARAGDFDAVIFCGGQGVQEFFSFRGTEAGLQAKRLIDEMRSQDKWVTALCMGPAILADAGVLAGGVPATGFGSEVVRKKIEGNGGVWSNPEAVVVSGRIITGRDDKTAGQFARRVVEALRTGR
jgi:serine/threonine protein kinase/putative intracellular protease/amidase